MAFPRVRNPIDEGIYQRDRFNKWREPSDSGGPSSETQNPYDSSNRPSNPQELKALIASGQQQGVNSIVGAMPDYQGTTYADGSLKSPYNYDPNDSKAFDKMSDISMSRGPTEVYQDQANVIDQGRNRDIDQLQQQGQINMAQGTSNLAQTGGLDSGARERLGDSNQLAQMKAQQNVYGDASGQRAQALAGDSAMKMKMLGGVSDTQTQAQQYNIQNSMGDLQNKNQANMYQWNKLGEITGSQKIADQMYDPDEKDSDWVNNIRSGKWSPLGIVPGTRGGTGDKDWLGTGVGGHSEKVGKLFGRG